jgi:tyrosyl-tRNA synthetase
MMVHSKADLENAVRASAILFGNASSSDLKQLDSQTFLDIFEGVPQAILKKTDLVSGINIIEILAGKTSFLKSNSEARRALLENSIAVNREKVSEDTFQLTQKDLINDAFVLLQRGKKNYFILKFE